MSFGVFVFPAAANATDTQVQVLVGDVCPNIAGNQPVLPAGMQFDQNGDCYTPTPPPPPDVCPNIAGHQAAIPAGYYRNQNGLCVTQSRPPRDVCPNIGDTQSEVPYGMLTAQNGDCIWPPTDVCPNIPGPQEKMPKGMRYNQSNECHTPVPVIPPTIEKPGSPTSPSAIFDPLPYYIIAGWAFVTFLLLLQTIRESYVTRGVIVFYKRKRSEGETKGRLIVVLVRYLTEAMDVMINNLPSTLAPNEESEEVIPLMTATRQLQTNIASTATHEPESTSNDPDAFSRYGIHVKTLLSPLFLISTTITIITVIAANILLGPSAPIAFGIHHLWLQVGLLFLTSLFLFLVLRSRHVRHIQHQHVEQLVKDEVIHDTERSDFLHRMHIVLDVGLHNIAPHRELMSDDMDSETFRKHYDRLTSINDALGLVYTQDHATKPGADTETDAYLVLEKTIASYLDDTNPEDKEFEVAKET